MIKYNTKIRLPKLLVLGMCVVISLSSISIGVNGVTNDNFHSGTLVASSDINVFGDLIYRSVESANVEVTTIETDFGGIAPFHPYFAQSLSQEDNIFYLSNGIAGFELFKDANTNGYVDNTNEIMYFVLLNATQGFEYSTITKETNDNSTIYQWYSNYYDIDGLLREGPAYAGTNSDMKKVLIPSFNITYTVVDKANTTDLSIKYNMGIWDAYTFHFDTQNNEIRTGSIDLTGLGLSIVYTSVLRSTEKVLKVDYATGDVISNVTFLYNAKSIFESSLNDSYMLTNESALLPVKTVIVPSADLLPEETSYWNLENDYLIRIKGWNTEVYNLPAIPGDEIPVQEAFYYRISYPQWDGQLIIHDPTYRANKVGTVIPLTNPIGSFTIPLIGTNGVVIISASTGLLVLALVLVKGRQKTIK